VNENAYDMEPVANSSSARATSNADAAAVVQYDAPWNASGPKNNLPPQHPAASHADGSDPVRDSTGEAQRHDSGMTLVDNTLYGASQPRSSTDALYANVPNASGPQNNVPPQHPAASHADGADPARDSTDEAQRHDSGTTLVDNTLYGASHPRSSTDALYANVPNASGPQNSVPPQRPSASHADGSDSARDSTDEAQRHDSGTTLVDNTLYEASNPRPNTKF